MMIDVEMVETVCTPLLNNLIASGYRSGFSNSVLHKMRDAVAEVDQDDGRALWSAACCGNMVLEREQGWQEIGFSREFIELYDRACKEEKKEGAFEMPSWGTSGT